MGVATGRPRGRPPGSKNKRTEAVKAAARATVSAVQAKADPETIFRGDAHALFVLVYQDMTQPLDVRLDAAGKAIRYEKPALAAVEMNATIKRDATDLSDAELAAIAAGSSVPALEAPAGPRRSDPVH